MTPLTASSTSQKSSQGHPARLLKEMLAEGRIYESVTTLRAPHGLLLTPLGVWRVGDMLLAAIYPGTRLSRHAASAYEACIGFTSRPISYIDAMLGSHRLTPPAAISTPCPAEAEIKIEAVIVARRRSGERLVLHMEPIEVAVTGKPTPYTRALGCTIELLISYTRARFWSKRPAADCPEATRWYQRLLTALDCIEHTASGDNELLEKARSFAATAHRALIMGGCVPQMLNVQPQPSSPGGAARLLENTAELPSATAPGRDARGRRLSLG